MPEVGRVLDAARALCRGATPWHYENADRLADLECALENLDARLNSAGSDPTKEIQDRVWGEVVEGDEILSDKTGKWYEVVRTVRSMDDATIKVNIKNVPHKPITRHVGAPVKLKRGVTGEAADVLEVLWSSDYTLGQVKEPATEEAPVAEDEVAE